MSDHPRHELDMRDGDSRRSLRRALVKRWDVPPEVMARCMKQCAELADLAATTGEMREFRGLMELMIRANKQDQDAEIHDEKMDAAREGVNVDGGLTIVLRPVEPKELPDG